MKRQIIAFTLVLASAYASFGQTGNIGVGTTTPGSKLTVNGSFAAAYTGITSTTYTIGENDYYIVWNGTAAGTVTLPASTSGADRTGRVYYIKNTTALYTLTIDAAGTELIDNAQTLIVQPGESALLIKTNINTATGATWEVIQVGKAGAPYILVAAGGSQNYPDASITKSNFTAIEYTTNGGVDFNTTTSTWTCPQTGTYKLNVEGQGTATANTHAGFSLNRGGTQLTIQYFMVPANLSNSGVVTSIVKLNAGDQITVNVHMCSGCSTTMNSTRRRLEITRM